MHGIVKECKMKKNTSKDIASWKIDSPYERYLAKKADTSFFWKKKYVNFYKRNDKQYYLKGLKFINDNIDKCSVTGKNTTKKQREIYTIDMVYSLHRFGCMFDEYFLYNFENLNVKGRLEFVTDKIRWDYYEIFNGRDNLPLFNNKDKTFEKYGKYFKRNLCGVKSIDDKEKFTELINNNEKVIIKPVDSSGGRGVQIIDTKNANFEVLLNEYKSGFVAEELLKNHSSFAEFNSSSLNTVRIATIRMDDRVVIPFAVARFGRKGKCVDNAFAGGIIANIDINTGVITSARDENGKHYIIHPDSKKCFLGFQVPDWNELIALVKEITRVVPENRYTGWDMAYTDKGWVLIEANPRGQLLSQIASQHGLKIIFDSLVDELKNQ